VTPQGGAYSQFKRALRGRHVIMAWGLAAATEGSARRRACEQHGLGQDVRVLKRWLDSQSELSS
jgi:hypothetical protein